MNKTKGLDFIKRYTMILVLIVVTAFFAWRTGGAILLPMNVSSLISQNAYVFILATGMLLCILTGGNIDLSVGSVVCFVGAIGAVLMVNMKMNMWLTILIMFVIGTLIGAAILGVLANGLTMLQIPTYMQDIITGGIIIFAVIAQKLGRGDAK